MKQPLFPSTIGTQSRFAYFLTVKAVVRKFGKSDGQTGSWCLDKAVLAQGGGGTTTWHLQCKSCCCCGSGLSLHQNPSDYAESLCWHFAGRKSF